MERVGTKWTADEEKTLLEEIAQGLTIEDIASRHERSAGGVTTKLHGIAHRLLTKENRSFDEVSSLVKLSPEEIQAVQKERDDRVERRKQRKAETKATKVKSAPVQSSIKTEEVLPLLIEIRDLLRKFVNRK